MTQIYHNPPASPKHAARRRSPLDARLDAAMFKALAEPTRTRILSCLIRCARPCSVTEVAACCDLDFSVVARHLSLLARAGVLDAQKEGRTVWYEARSEALRDRFRAIADAIDEAHCCAPGGGTSCCPDTNRDTGRNARPARKRK